MPADPIPEKKEKDRLTAMLLPSFLGILLCMVCLCQMTWAWFSASQTNEIAPIRSAEYTIDVGVTDGAGAVTVSDHRVTLGAGATYTVTLTARGTASTGFCILSYSEDDGSGNPVAKDLHTAQIAPGASLSFTIETQADVLISFAPQWGTSVRKDHPDIISGSILTVR